MSYPNGKTYNRVIVPKVLKRCGGECEECGRKSYLWVTPIRDMTDWERLEIPDVEPLPVSQSNIRAVCYRCSHKYLPEANLFAEFLNKKQQLTLSFGTI